MNERATVGSFARSLTGLSLVGRRNSLSIVTPRPAIVRDEVLLLGRKATSRQSSASERIFLERDPNNG